MSSINNFFDTLDIIIGHNLTTAAFTPIKRRNNVNNSLFHNNYCRLYKNNSFPSMFKFHLQYSINEENFGHFQIDLTTHNDVIKFYYLSKNSYNHNHIYFDEIYIDIKEKLKSLLIGELIVYIINDYDLNLHMIDVLINSIFEDYINNSIMLQCNDKLRDNIKKYSYGQTTFKCYLQALLIDIFNIQETKLKPVQPFDMIIKEREIIKEIPKYIDKERIIDKINVIDKVVEKVVEKRRLVLQNQYEFTKDLEDCIICAVNKSNTIFKCGHINVCSDCYKRGDLKKCPMCRYESQAYNIGTLRKINEKEDIEILSEISNIIK